MSPARYAGVLPLGAYEGGLTWKKGLCKYDQLEGGHLEEAQGGPSV